MRFQIVYDATLNIEDFQENLKARGYKMERIVSSRNPDIYTDNFTFELTQKVKVNVYPNAIELHAPRMKMHKIQVGWNSVKEMEENEILLMELIGSDRITATYLILNLQTQFLYHHKFLSELESLYLKHLKAIKKREKFLEEIERLSKVP